MARCEQCGTRLVPGSAWCGGCGALVGAGEEPDDRFAVGAGRPRSRRRVPPAVVLGALVALVAVGGVLRSSAPPPTPAPDAPVALPGTPPRAEADEQPREVVRWALDGVVVADDRDDVVRAAGSQHVTVGQRVLSTVEGATVGPAVRRLPVALLGSIGPGGEWAVAEAGAVTRGRLGGGGTRTTVPRDADGWAPAGVPVAWHGSGAVLAGTGGRLGLVAADGALVWRSEVAVDVTGPVGAAWMLGVDRDGDGIAVGLEDGAVVALDRAWSPLAVAGDVLVVATDGGTAGVTLPGAAVRWQRPTRPDAMWHTTPDGLVEVAGEQALLVDPATGEELARIDGVEPLPTRGGAVIRRGTNLLAQRWDGTFAWIQALGSVGTHRAVVPDPDRVAVLSRNDAGSVDVNVLDAVEGNLLATVGADDALPAAPAVVAAGGGRVAVRGTTLPGADGVAVVDARTGAVVPGADPATLAPVAGPGPAPTGPPGRAVGSVVLTVTPRASVEDPFGTLPGTVLARAGEDGPIRWRASELSTVGVDPGGPLYAGPDASEVGPLVLEVGVTTVRGRRLDTGTTVWTRHVDAPVVAAPVRTGARFVVPLGDGTLLGLDPATGATAWTGELPAAATVLRTSGTELVVGTIEGDVLRLDSLGRVVGRRDGDGRAVLDLVRALDTVLVVRSTGLVGLGDEGPPGGDVRPPESSSGDQ